MAKGHVRELELAGIDDDRGLSFISAPTCSSTLERTIIFPAVASASLAARVRVHRDEAGPLRAHDAMIDLQETVRASHEPDAVTGRRRATRCAAHLGFRAVVGDHDPARNLAKLGVLETSAPPCATMTPSESS